MPLFFYLAHKLAHFLAHFRTILDGIGRFSAIFFVKIGKEKTLGIVEISRVFVLVVPRGVEPRIPA